MRPEDLVHVLRVVGISDRRVVQAVRATPRADFVPPEYTNVAYHDDPVPIGHGQVTTQPSLSARMIEALDLSSEDRVLEVGTGLGFQTALLARLAAEVVSVERLADLSRQAAENLARHDIGNVVLLVGDGSCGAPEHAPYDAVIVSAAYPEVPSPLVEQLRDGGRLVQPIGHGGDEQVMLFQRTADGLKRRRVLVAAHFVRLYGQHGYGNGTW